MSIASVGSGEPECIWEDCDQQAIYCEGHAREFVDPLGRLVTPAVDYRKALEEAVIAWSVCASLHREYCRKTDPHWTKRQADFVKHEADARTLLAAQAPKDAE